MYPVSYLIYLAHASLHVYLNSILPPGRHSFPLNGSLYHQIRYIRLFRFTKFLHALCNKTQEVPEIILDIYSLKYFIYINFSILSFILFFILSFILKSSSILINQIFIHYLTKPFNLNQNHHNSFQIASPMENFHFHSCSQILYDEDNESNDLVLANHTRHAPT